MGKLNLILLSLFAILLHANLSSNEKCLQQLWEEILIEEKEPDAMCGLNDEQSVKQIDIFKGKLDEYKKALLDQIPEDPAKIGACDVFNLRPKTLALAIKREREAEDCVHGDQLSGHFTKNCPAKPNYRHMLAWSWRIKPIDDANIVDQNFNFYFFVHNLYTAEYNRVKHLQDELCHNSNFEDIVKPFESEIDCFGKTECVVRKVVGGIFSGRGLFNLFSSCDEPIAAYSDEKIPKPEADYPNKHNPYIILEHNCTLGGSSLYQVIRLSEINLGGKKKSTENRDIQIELRTKADNKNYTFDSLMKLQYHDIKDEDPKRFDYYEDLAWQFGKGGKDIAKVNEEGIAAMKTWVLNAGNKYNLTAKIPNA